MNSLPGFNRHLFRACFPGQFTYLIKEIRDADDQNLIRIFPQSVSFVRQSKASSTDSVHH